MNITDIENSINNYFDNNWPYTDVFFENSRNAEDSPILPFVESVFLPVDNELIEIGEGGATKFTGIYSIDINTSLGDGIGESSELQKKVMDLFIEGTILASFNDKNIYFEVPQPLQGLKLNQTIYLRTVHCPFFTFSVGD